MITLPTYETSKVESTHLSVTNRKRTYVDGLTDCGTFSFECNYSADTYTLLYGLLGAGTKPVVVTSPVDENQKFTFNAFMSKGPDCAFEPDTISKIKVEMKVDGEVTLGTITP